MFKKYFEILFFKYRNRLFVKPFLNIVFQFFTGEFIEETTIKFKYMRFLAILGIW